MHICSQLLSAAAGDAPSGQVNVSTGGQQTFALSQEPRSPNGSVSETRRRTASPNVQMMADVEVQATALWPPRAAQGGDRPVHRDGPHEG